MQKKKKKQEELLEIWTNLKGKLMPIITELKEIKERGYSQVYLTTAPLQKLHISQETPESKVVRLENQLVTDSYGYQQQLWVATRKYTDLEKKLEQVRNLIADNKIEKLIRLMKRGEI